MATREQLQADLPWNINRLSVEPGEHGSDAALDVLNGMDDNHTTVETVRAYAAADGDGQRIATNDLLRVLQRAEGRLALVTWSTMGIAAIGYLPGQQRFDVARFSGIAKRMGKDPESYERTTRAKAKDKLAWSEPTVITRDESKLLPELDGVEVTA